MTLLRRILSAKRGAIVPLVLALLVNIGVYVLVVHPLGGKSESSGDRAVDVLPAGPQWSLNASARRRSRSSPCCWRWRRTPRFKRGRTGSSRLAGPLRRLIERPRKRAEVARLP